MTGGNCREVLCNIDSIGKPCLLVFVVQALIILSPANRKKYVLNHVWTKNTCAAFNEFSQCWCRYQSTCIFCSRSMHLYLKRSGDGGRGSLEMMAFLVKGWKLNLIISVKITQEHLWFYTLRKIFQQKHLETFVEAGHQETRKGKCMEKTRLSTIQACQGRWGRNCRRGSSQTYEPWWAYMDGSCQGLGGPKNGWLRSLLTTTSC